MPKLREDFEASRVTAERERDRSRKQRIVPRKRSGESRSNWERWKCQRLCLPISRKSTISIKNWRATARRLETESF